MGHEALVVLNEPEAGSVETQNEVSRQGVQLLSDRLSCAFPSPDGEDGGSPERAPPAGVGPSFSQASTRQAEALQEFAGHFYSHDHENDFAGLRGEMRDLCEALIAVTSHVRLIASETDKKLEAVTEAMAMMAGHVATQRDEARANTASIAALSDELKHFHETANANSVAIADLRAHVQGVNDVLKNDLLALNYSVEPLIKDVGSATRRLMQLENRTASYTDMEADVGNLRHRMTDLGQAENSIVELIKRNEQADARFHVIARDIGTITDQVHFLGASAERNAADLRASENAVSALRASAEHTAAGLRATENVVAALGASTEHNAANLRATESAVAALGARAQHNAANLRAAENAVAAFLRREKAMATLHAHAARLLVPSVDDDAADDLPAPVQPA